MHLIQDVYQLPSDTYTQPLVLARRQGSSEREYQTCARYHSFSPHFSMWERYRSDSWLSTLRRDSCVDLIHRHVEQQSPSQSAVEDGCELASSSRVTRACASHIFPDNEVAVTMGYGVDDEQAQGCGAEGPAHRGDDRKKKTRILNEPVGLTGWYLCDALKLCEMKPVQTTTANPRRGSMAGTVKNYGLIGAQLGPSVASFSSSLRNNGLGFASGVPATTGRRSHTACWAA